MEKRYDEINDFEKILTQNDVHILKFFLHISDEEQEKRFEGASRRPAKELEILRCRFHRTQVLEPVSGRL